MTSYIAQTHLDAPSVPPIGPSQQGLAHHAADTGIPGLVPRKGGAQPTNSSRNRLLEIDADDQKVVQRKAHLLMFRDGQFTDNAIRRWIWPNTPANSFKYKIALDYCSALWIRLQVKMFCGKELKKLLRYHSPTAHVVR
jgi:hypothetical protein